MYSKYGVPSIHRFLSRNKESSGGVVRQVDTYEWYIIRHLIPPALRQATYTNAQGQSRRGIWKNDKAVRCCPGHVVDSKAGGEHRA